ncbi:MAG TPA: type VI secretion system baseplate subunit TssF [Bryobacteraceae bacterium]|nr:type VI secretion system baseplate subunit TssF [Bryobacteraceae bacterium]
MSNELLTYYERELVFIRQMAAEFAQKYPDRAGALKLSNSGSEDPHVERLMEAFALIAGRIHRKIDDEFPEITQAVLDILYPHYLRPIPSMSVAQFELEPEQSKVATGYLVPKDSKLYSRPVNGAICHFKTCYPVQLWPIEVVSAAFLRSSSIRGGLAGSDVPFAVQIELRMLGGLKLSQLPLSDLRFFLGGDQQTAFTLYELLFNNFAGITVRAIGQRNAAAVLNLLRIREVGFNRDEGMVPYSDRSFLGYRLLQEYFSFPQKFLFFDLAGLEQLPKDSLGDRFEVLILLTDFERDDRAALLEQAVTAESFRLGCTPIVNLFERTAEPIRVSHSQTEYRVVPDIRYPLSTEVYSVERVTSVAPYAQEPEEYRPFYSFRHADGADPQQVFWLATRRRSGIEDEGTDVYLSLVNSKFEPSLPPVESLTVHVTCTNRSLAGKLPVKGQFGELEMESGALLRIRLAQSLTPTAYPPLRRGLQWRLISHLGLNYLSIVDGGVEALRELLKLYDSSGAPSAVHQINGITKIKSRAKVARMTSEHGLTFATGVHVEAEFDEDEFVGTSVFLLATVLERFFGLYSALNSFTQFRATTLQRKGVLKEWPPRAGEQILL